MSAAVAASAEASTVAAVIGSAGAFTVAAVAASAGACLIAAIFSLQLGQQYVARRRPHAFVWCASLGLFAVAAGSVVVGLTAGWSPTVYAVFWLTGALVTVPLLAAGQLMLLDPARTVLYGTIAALAVLWGIAGVLLSPINLVPLAAATQASSIPQGEQAYGGTLAHALLRPFNYSAVVVVLGTVWSAVRSRRFRILGIAIGVLVAGTSFAFVRAGSAPLFGVSLAAGVALMYGGFLAAGAPRSSAGAATGPDLRRPRVTVYTRVGCGLCREAEEVVERVASGRAEIEFIDIDSDPSITERYTVRVPVVAVDGREIAQYEVAPEDLIHALDAAARSPSSV